GGRGFHERGDPSITPALVVSRRDVWPLRGGPSIQMEEKCTRSRADSRDFSGHSRAPAMDCGLPARRAPGAAEGELAVLCSRKRPISVARLAQAPARANWVIAIRRSWQFMGEGRFMRSAAVADFQKRSDPRSSSRVA